MSSVVAVDVDESGSEISCEQKGLLVSHGSRLRQRLTELEALAERILNGRSKHTSKLESHLRALSESFLIHRRLHQAVDLATSRRHPEFELLPWLEQTVIDTYSDHADADSREFAKATLNLIEVARAYLDMESSELLSLRVSPEDCR